MIRDFLHKAGLQRRARLLVVRWARPLMRRGLGVRSYRVVNFTQARAKRRQPVLY